jgi:hypothetical protein
MKTTVMVKLEDAAPAGVKVICIGTFSLPRCLRSALARPVGAITIVTNPAFRTGLRTCVTVKIPGRLTGFDRLASTARAGACGAARTSTVPGPGIFTVSFAVPSPFVVDAALSMTHEPPTSTLPWGQSTRTLPRTLLSAKVVGAVLEDADATT